MRFNDRAKHRVAVLLLFLVCCFSTPIEAQEVTSGWFGSSESNDWFYPDNWSAGVPNGPGHRAIVLGDSSQEFMPVVTAPVALGRLDFGERFTATLSGDAAITFDNPGAPVAELRLVPRRANDLEVILSAPLMVATGESLEVWVGQRGRLVLESPIASAAGDVAFTGPDSEAHLSHSNTLLGECTTGLP